MERRTISKYLMAKISKHNREDLVRYPTGYSVKRSE